MIGYIYCDPSPEIFSFNLPFLGRPILWYGVLFALGFLLGYAALVYVLKHQPNQEIQKKAKFIAEKLSFYVVIGMILGARLFDVLFYQDLSQIKQDPIFFLKVWEGGLASHGGVIGVVIAMTLFLRKYRLQFRALSWRKLLDWMAICTGVVAFFIRIGNFMNQEILGTKTAVPWAVVFGHPFDHSFPSPRHPVQLYEAFFYLALFFLFFGYFRKKSWKEGRVAGLFLVLIFSFRFVVEFFKEEQSAQLSTHAFLDMGQYLSLPLIGFGLYLLFLSRK